MRVIIVRGTALNKWEMQNYEPLRPAVDLLAVGQRGGAYDTSDLALPAVYLPTPATLAAPAGRGGRAGLRLLHPWLDAERLIGLERVLAGADIVHAAETFIPFSAQAAAATGRNGARLVLTCWENIPFLYDDDPRLRARKRAVQAGADLFLAVTEGARQALMLEGVPETRIRVIPAGVDQRLFQPRPRDAALAAAWGLPAEARVVLYSGRLVREKGLSDLLQAAALLYAGGDHADVRFVLVGGGPEQGRLATMVARLGLAGRVIFVPPQPYRRMPGVYSLADVFVLPSVPTPYWQEQFGMVLAEAMACGKAIVTTSSGAIPEVVGEAAVLVPPYTPAVLARALNTLLCDAAYCRALGGAARERAARLYDATCVAGQIKDAYETLLARD